ncbi:uncharacterized protein FA14DRAFT_156529 [Meira miltonrushii]|uniref:Uncharacterized protein n=1 Tax=Meira miltonrushii TaxID=1280837 RepID=A0A316V8N3_9BASI|nr:uncharacterized protein FA14DRAFT_156529 [Meira miltonrushii]PWN33850.1 hypothetical protein FA14DRAFT_156529 [Meira miltonrushii]
MSFSPSSQGARRLTSSQPLDQRRQDFTYRPSSYSPGRMTKSDRFNCSDSNQGSRSFSPSSHGDMPPPGPRASYQKKTRFASPSPPRQQSSGSSSSPARAVKHSEEASERWDHDNSIPAEGTSKSCNGMPPPNGIKRKVPMDESIESNVDFMRTVRARSSSSTEPAAVPTQETSTEDPILKVIHHIESLAESKYQLCMITSKKNELSRVAEGGAETMSKASQKRYNEVCDEVKYLGEKVEACKSSLFGDLKNLLSMPDLHAGSLCRASDEENGIVAAGEQQTNGDGKSIKNELEEQSDEDIQHLSNGGGSHVEEVLQEVLEQTLPGLIDQAFTRHSTNVPADYASSSRKRQSTSSNDGDYASKEAHTQHEFELVKLRGLVTELQLNSLKKDRDFEQLQSRMNDLHQKMNAQERFVIFHNAAILRHEASLQDLD